MRRLLAVMLFVLAGPVLAQNAPLSGLTARGAAATTDLIPVAPVGVNRLESMRVSDLFAALPPPSGGSLGGVNSFGPIAHQWVSAISTAGAITGAQPACADLSDAALKCITDSSGNVVISHFNFGTSASGSTFWAGDGTWKTAAAAGGGTVTSVTCGVGMSGGTITGVGTCDLVSNGTALGKLVQIAPNTILSNWTGSTANVAANAMPSCADTGGQHLNYVNGTGVTCGAGVGLVAPIRVVTAAGAVAVTAADYVVAIDKTVGSATTVNLEASPATGQVHVIKDDKGDAATNHITVAPAAGNIDGAGTAVLAGNHQSLSLVYDGTQWEIF